MLEQTDERNVDVSRLFKRKARSNLPQGGLGNLDAATRHDTVATGFKVTTNINEIIGAN